MSRRLTAGLVLAVVVASCSVRIPPSAPALSPDEPSASPPASVPATPIPTAGPSAVPTSAPVGSLPPVLEGVRLDVTRICEGPPEGEVELVNWCRHAFAAAIDSLGPDAVRVAAAWYRRGIACPPNARCVGPTPDVGHVVLRLADGPVLTVPLQFVTEGIAAGAASAPSWDLWPHDPLPVQTPAPPVDLGPDAPDELAGREPYPFCGSEDDVFDRNVRRCFWDAVTLHQAPAEFITAVPGPDGALVRVVHRYAGSGSVLVYRDVPDDAAADGWTKESCALQSVGDDQLIFLVTECVRLPLA